MSIRTYSELIRISTFEDRLGYLRLFGSVGQETFGFDRYMNQQFYRSREGEQVRDFVIVRDGGCDLGISGREIWGKILIHHMNPIKPDDIKHSTDFLLNPEYLISVSHLTHNAIHYGEEILTTRDVAERHKNDTCPWKNERSNSNENY
ncbi:MAG: hypothetical protein LUD77_09365 [Clostridiales bacterium]|nr:hypothetical protein [Clostridiales bacterium]